MYIKNLVVIKKVLLIEKQDLFENTYYTVEQLKFKIGNNEEPRVNGVVEQKRTKLISIINKIIPIFGNVDKEVEYLVEDDDVIAELYLAPPLSLNDLKKLEELSNELCFSYNAISGKKEINKKNRNSLIKIFL